MPRKKKVDSVETIESAVKETKTTTKKGTSKSAAPKATKANVKKVTTKKDEKEKKPVVEKKQTADTKKSVKKVDSKKKDIEKKEAIDTDTKVVKKTTSKKVAKKSEDKKVSTTQTATKKAEAKKVAAKSSSKKSNSAVEAPIKKEKKVSVKKETSKSAAKKVAAKVDVKVKAKSEAKKTTTKSKADAKKEPATKKTKVAKTTKSTKTSKTTSATKALTRKKKESAKIETIEYYDLPYRYNQTLVKLLYQTPNILFIYWDISDADRLEMINQYGNDFFDRTQPVLIIHNKTLNYSFETEIDDFANSWYLHINDTNCEYSVELGRKPKYNYNNNDNQISLPGNYLFVANSNKVESPNDHILFDKDMDTVYFKDVKTNIITKESITSLSFLRNMGRIYSLLNLDDIFKKAKKYLQLDLTNPSSANPTSTFK